MRRAGQLLTILGILLLFSPEWLPMDAWAARGIAVAAFLVGLTVTVLGSILGNLPADARMDALDERVPAPCAPLVE
jgi:hypothetical protein